jgi:hypothetical protein
MNLTLKQLFIIWAVCSANYDTLTNLKAADFAAIDKKAGLPAGTSAGVIGFIKTENGNGAAGKTPLELAASIFQDTATNQGYVPPVGGAACGSVTEILGGF